MPPKNAKEGQVAPQTLERFLDLPEDLIREIPELASSVSYKESTLIMSRLSRSSKRMRAIFQPELDKRAAKQLMEYVLKPTEDNLAKAKKMYKANPRLIFIEVKDEVEEYAAGITTRINDKGVQEHVAVHRKVKGLSPFQAALGAGDEGIYKDMASHFDKVIDKEGKPIGRERAIQQFKEQFPNGFDYPASHYDFNALAAVITADQVLHQDDNPAIVKNPSEPTKKALAQFRDDFLPKKALSCGHHFNLNHLLKAFEVYNAHWEQWNWNQRSLFWCQVIGYLERLVPAVDAQAFCQGFYYLLDEKQPATRRFRVENWDAGGTMAYFPLPSGAVGSGFDFGIYIGSDARGVRGCSARSRAAAAAIYLKNYVEQKHQALTALSNTLNSQLIVQNDDRGPRGSA